MRRTVRGSGARELRNYGSNYSGFLGVSILVLIVKEQL